VGGFHSWLYFHDQEVAGNVDYKGWIVKKDFGLAAGVTNVNTWLGADKPIGGFFLGTSPELDFALKTVCALTRPGQQCRMRFGNQSFKIQTYVDSRQGGRKTLGTAYPIFD